MPVVFGKSPDVVVMDKSMPGIGGLGCIRRICSQDSLSKALVFSVHDELVYVARALGAVAKGYAMQKIAEELCLGYKTVANYGAQIKSKLAVSTVAGLAHLGTTLGLTKK